MKSLASYLPFRRDPKGSACARLSTIVCLCLASLPILFCGCSTSHNQSSNAPSTQPQQATFSSPDQAAQALVDALRTNDEARLHEILGASADQILTSGDDVADQQNRQKFLADYDAKHDLTTASDGSDTLDVGNDNWPMPIPIVNDNGNWHFDTEAGLDEIINRRIGKNELDTIQTCNAIVDAQDDYVSQNPTDADVPEYAMKFFSDPGEKNGLYWPTSDDEQQSPLGPLVGIAADQGYIMPPVTPGTPYHGYHYRMLTSQGPDAQGGACDYIADGKMIGGWAVVAWPAQYGNSGVMTFIVNYQGAVYQKDLGDNTDSIAGAMTAFDPDSSWTAVH